MIAKKVDLCRIHGISHIYYADSLTNSGLLYSGILSANDHFLDALVELPIIRLLYFYRFYTICAHPFNLV